jgi:hypothetical protein
VSVNIEIWTGRSDEIAQELEDEPRSAQLLQVAGGRSCGRTISYERACSETSNQQTASEPGKASYQGKLRPDKSSTALLYQADVPEGPSKMTLNEWSPTPDAAPGAQGERRQCGCRRPVNTAKAHLKFPKVWSAAIRSSSAERPGRSASATSASRAKASTRIVRSTVRCPRSVHAVRRNSGAHGPGVGQQPGASGQGPRR